MTHRERAWTQMARRDVWTTREVAQAAGVSERTVHQVILLLPAGWVETLGRAASPAGGYPIRYRLRKDVRQERPFGRGATSRRRAWMAMRILRTFTVADIMTTTGIGYGVASEAVRTLCRAGYVRELGRRQPIGQPGSAKMYRLVRDVGPEPPPREVRHE